MYINVSTQQDKDFGNWYFATVPQKGESVYLDGDEYEVVKVEHYPNKEEDDCTVDLIVRPTFQTEMKNLTELPSG